MAKKEKICSGCKLQYMCRLQRDLWELWEQNSFKLVFETTAKGVNTHKEIEKVVAGNCIYYTERTE